MTDASWQHKQFKDNYFEILNIISDKIKKRTLTITKTEAGVLIVWNYRLCARYDYAEPRYKRYQARDILLRPLFSVGLYNFVK